MKEEDQDTVGFERVLIFLDQPNMSCTFKELGVCPDYKKLLRQLLNGRELVEARFYIRSGHGQSVYSWKIQRDGWKDYWTNGDDDVDSYIIQDIRLAIRERCADTIVLVSGDIHYFEVVQEATLSGIRVEIFSDVDHRNRKYDEAQKQNTKIRVLEAYRHLDHFVNWKKTRQVFGEAAEELVKARARRTPNYSAKKKAEKYRKPKPAW